MKNYYNLLKKTTSLHIIDNLEKNYVTRMKDSEGDKVNHIQLELMDNLK